MTRSVLLLLTSLVSLSFLIGSTSSLARIVVDDNDVNNDPIFRSGNEEWDPKTKAFMFLTKSPYDKFSRPFHRNNPNNTQPVQVNASLDIVTLVAVDEVASEYTVSVKMELEWWDHRIVDRSLDHKEPVSISPIYVERVWYPKLGVPNVKEPGSLLLTSQDTLTNFKVRMDGYVYIRTGFQLTLFCHLNYKSYPFDVQKCSIKLESKGMNTANLVFQWRKERPFINSDRFQLTGFELFDHDIFNDSVVEVNMYDGEAMSRIGANLHLKRVWYHFLLDVYLPSGLFVVMSWVSFWLEISAAPARVTLGMTAMLTLVTSSQFSRERLPKVSYIHAMDLWIAVCICFVFSSLIEYAIVSYLFTKDKSQRQRLKSLQMEVSTLSLATMATNNIQRYCDVPELSRTKVSLIIPTLANNLRRLSAESKSTSNLLEPMMDSELMGSDHFSDQLVTKAKKQSLSRRLFKYSADELADTIDRKSRWLFPLMFVLFNVVYWTSFNI